MYLMLHLLFLYFQFSNSEMSNGSIFHKRLGILYNVGDYELFYFNTGAKVNEKDVEDKYDLPSSSSYRQISRMIYQRQYKVCAMDGGLPLMVRFSDKVEIKWKAFTIDSNINYFST